MIFFRPLLLCCLFVFVCNVLQAQVIVDYYDSGEQNNINTGGTVGDASTITLDTVASTSFEEYFDADTLGSINQNSTAGAVTNFSLDTDCGVLSINVADPDLEPLPAFNAYILNPIGEDGERINLRDNVHASFRVRSAEAVNIEVLFRSGGGTTDERTERKSFAVPAGLDTWTEFTLTWGAGDLAGFDPTDVRDFWFYLNRGTENFPGNALFIDYITIGVAPDSTRNSTCTLVELPQASIENWNSENTIQLAGSDIDRLNLERDAICEELRIEVADPATIPLQAFRPLIISPVNSMGMDFNLISAPPFMNIRARSAEPVELGILLRSKDGTAEFRTDILTQTIQGDLTGYSNLVFQFDEASLGNFDPTDFVDIWIYLDRDVDNFAGNEVYLDYVALNLIPDMQTLSPCGLPDLVISNIEELPLGKVGIYPNPTSDRVVIAIPSYNDWQNLTYEITNMLGQRITTQQQINKVTTDVDFSYLESGIYWLTLKNDAQILQSTKIIKVD